jgi:uncharacterized protein
MHIGLIVKVSKFCNLRCGYCCEMEYLADRQRMSMEQIIGIFHSVRFFVDRFGSGDDRLSFYWHGGEPLVQPISYWNAILDAEEEILGATLHSQTVNALQSNLTLVKSAHLALFARARIGFSFDVVNDLRVDRNGYSTHAKVVKNIDWLIGRGISLAGIAVVSTANCEHPAAVAGFYLDRYMPFRFILLDEALEHRPEIERMRIPLTGFVEFAMELWRLPRVRRALADGLRIDPLSEALALLQARHSDARSTDSFENLAKLEHLLEVDIDGAVYSTADYPYQQSYGNLFVEPIESLLLSDARKHRIERSRQRLLDVCGSCQFFGQGCFGARVSHATEPVYGEYRCGGGCELRLIADAIQAAETEDVA